MSSLISNPASSSQGCLDIHTESMILVANNFTIDKFDYCILLGGERKRAWENVGLPG